MTDIGLMVRSANPVPDDSQQLTDDELNAVLLLAQQRSGNMDVKDAVRPIEQEQKPAKRGWLVAAAAFAVVIAVVGIAYLFSSANEEQAPATTPPTTAPVTTTIGTSPTTTLAAEETEAAVVEEEPVESIVEEPVMTPGLQEFVATYATAWNGDDAEAFAALFDETAARENDGDLNLVSREKLLAERDHLLAQQSELTLSNCEARSNGVRCETTLDGPVEQALTGAPLESITRFHLNEDGLITFVEATSSSVFGADDPWTQFMAWMADTHPTVHGEMYMAFTRDLVAYEDSVIYLEYAPLWAEAGRP